MKKYIFLTVFTLFFACSGILFYLIPTDAGHRDIDSSEYEIIGKHYAKTGNLFHPEEPTTMPSHTVGYHWFLGTLFSVIDQTAILFFIQVLLCLLIGGMLYHLTKRMFNQSVANCIIVLFSFNLGFLVYAQLILAEILLVTLLTGFIYFFCLFITQKHISNLLCASFLIGCSVLVKPVALYFIIPLSCILLFFKTKTMQQRVTHLALLLCFFYVPVISYMCYNYKTFNNFCVTNLVSENIYIYFLPRRTFPQLDEATRILYQQQIDASINKEEKLALSKEIFLSIAKKHPTKIFYAWSNAMLRTFFGLYSTQLKSMFNPSIQGGSCSFFNMQGTFLKRMYNYITFGSTSSYLSLIASLESCWLLLQYFFILIALFSLLLQKRYALLSFFFSYIGYFSFVTGHDGCGRYRLMFEPILLILAALGIIILYQALTKQKENSIKVNLQFST